MARLPLVTADRAAPGVRLAFWFTRRGLRRMTGRETPTMLEPLQVYAHAPALLKGYGQVEQATARMSHLSRRHRHLAELKAATMTHCEYCIDLGSQVARRESLTDEELLALPAYATSPLFDETDRLVLDHAVAMSTTPVDVPDALFARLRERFTPAQVVELTHVIAIENHRGRFNLAMGIGASGFSAGMVCAVPVTHAGATAAGR
jgi:4-carboxymuconolactone decarboxylase